MQTSGNSSGAAFTLAALLIAPLTAAGLGWVLDADPAVFGVATLIGVGIVAVICAFVFAVLGHARERARQLRRLGNPAVVASLGPPSSVSIVSAVILLLPAMLFLAGAVWCFNAGEPTAIAVGSIPLLISLAMQAGAWMRLRDYAHWRAAWQESLATGEAKGRWVTLPCARANSEHNTRTGML